MAKTPEHAGMMTSQSLRVRALLLEDAAELDAVVSCHAPMLGSRLVGGTPSAPSPGGAPAEGGRAPGPRHADGRSEAVISAACTVSKRPRPGASAGRRRSRYSFRRYWILRTETPSISAARAVEPPTCVERAQDRLALDLEQRRAGDEREAPARPRGRALEHRREIVRRESRVRSRHATARSTTRASSRTFPGQS